ncbi:hypothetical protein [Streptomyces sp. B6B3]|uniref:hypothetical protein n=1 Tax=Streptomyces sp. B6B3 TaxID=3153570 RepID=UPI00325F8043
MATRHDQEMQERRRRLRKRQEQERQEVRRRQQAEAAALNDLDSAAERLRAAQAAMAEAVTRALEAFPSVDDLAEMTPFDVRELRAYERRHRREKHGTHAALPGARDHVPLEQPGDNTRAGVTAPPTRS